MKYKVVNRSLILLLLTVFFGLFQAWKESKNSFAFYSNNKNKIVKFKYISNKEVTCDTKKNYIVNKYLIK